MKTTKGIFVFYIIALLIMSCNTDTKVKLPVETSVGSLVSVEQKENVMTDRKDLAINSEEIFYLLTFKGKSEFVLNGPFDKSDPIRVLVDQDGTEYWPVYYGSMGENGVITGNDWMFSGGNLTGGEDGQLVYVDVNLTLPKPEFTLVYSIRKNVKELSLRDGDKQFPVK